GGDARRVTELDTLATIARVPPDPPRSALSRAGRSIMTPPTPLSVVSERTSVPAISTLMHMALANPGLISLAAGFVDQESLPADEASRAIAALLEDPAGGRRALQYGTTIGDIGLRERILSLLEQDERVQTGAFHHL